MRRIVTAGVVMAIGAILSGPAAGRPQEGPSKPREVLVTSEPGSLLWVNHRYVGDLPRRVRLKVGDVVEIDMKISYRYKGEEALRFRHREGRYLVNDIVFGVTVSGRVPSGLKKEEITSVELSADLTEGLARELTQKTSISSLTCPVSMTDAGLAHLKGLSNLSSLDLWATKITDTGLAHLKSLSNLSWLDLQSTKITDAGLAHLKSLSNLSSLDLSGTKITGAAARQFEKDRPGCRILGR